MSTVAHETMFAHPSAGEVFEVRIEVGAPFEDQPHEWVCPLSLSPLHKKEMKIRGDSSLQAMSLALALAKTLLDDFVEKGGRLTYKSGESFDLNATFGTRVAK